MHIPFSKFFLGRLELKGSMSCLLLYVLQFVIMLILY